MGRVPEGMRRITVNIERTIADWLDEYARERGLGREHIVETALLQLKERGPR